MAATFDVGGDAVTHSNSEQERAFVGMWQDARSRADAPVPHWRDLRPGDLAPFAPDLHVFTLRDDGMQVRYVGTNVDRIYGGHIRPGMVVPYFVSEEGMRIASKVYRSSLDTPCGSRIVRVMRVGGTRLTGISVALPVRAASDTPDTLVVRYALPGGLSADDIRGRKFHVTEIEYFDLGFGVAHLADDLAMRLNTDLSIRDDLKGQSLIDE